MKLFIYTDHKVNKVVFTFIATSLFSADSAYTDKFGVHPAKLHHVGVEIKDIASESWGS